MILGKLGLSEYANSFGNQPSGFSNLTGQVLNGARRRPEPERLVVGLRRGRRRRAVDADRSAPRPPARSSARRRRNGLVGLRPDGRARARLRHRADLGLAGHRRPDGPHRRQRGDDAAVDRRARPRQRASTTAHLRARASRRGRSSRRVPATVPNYMSALDLNFVRGKRIGYNGTLDRGHAAQARLRRARRRRRDHGRSARRSTPGRARRCPAATSSTRRHRRVLQAPRPGRADQVAGRGDRRQPGQRARGAEVRQRHHVSSLRDRHQPRLAADRVAYRTDLPMRQAAQPQGASTA